ncbi:hypothetical protein XENTR_v10018413 [Xenopus tropicalis]|nr:hypothetical protein XENTR_v10018413 [Xenopus tropicalis]
MGQTSCSGYKVYWICVIVESTCCWKGSVASIMDFTPKRYKVSDHLRPFKLPCITRLTWCSSFATVLITGCRHGSLVVQL